MWESIKYCIYVSFCWFVPSVLACGSLDLGQNIVTTSLASSKAATFPSHSRVFLPGGAGLLISCIVFLLRLCAQLSQQTELPEEAVQVTPPLPSSILLCKAGCRCDAGSMFALLELTPESLSSPSPGWGPAGLVCSPTLECLMSCVDSGYPARGLGGSRVVSRVPSLTAHMSHGPLWSNEFKCPWKESIYNLTGIKEFYLSQAEHYSLGGSLLNNSEELLWFSFLFWACCMACGRRGMCRVLSSNQGSNPCPLQWTHRILPGNSQNCPTEAWFPAQSYASSNREHTSHTTGCILSSFKKKQT